MSGGLRHAHAVDLAARVPLASQNNSSDLCYVRDIYQRIGFQQQQIRTTADCDGAQRRRPANVFGQESPRVAGAGRECLKGGEAGGDQFREFDMGGFAREHSWSGGIGSQKQRDSNIVQGERELSDDSLFPPLPQIEPPQIRARRGILPLPHVQDGGMKELRLGIGPQLLDIVQLRPSHRHERQVRNDGDPVLLDQTDCVAQEILVDNRDEFAIKLALHVAVQHREEHLFSVSYHVEPGR